MRSGFLGLVALAIPLSAAAQDGARAPGLLLEPAPTIHHDLEDRRRLLEIRGRTTLPGLLHRSLSSVLAPELRPVGDTLNWRIFAPELHVVNNSALPFSQNDGALWAGRGVSWRLAFGGAGSWGDFRMVLMPELIRTSNVTFVDTDLGRWWKPPMDYSRYSRHASHWNQHPFHIDLPVRFGEQGYRELSPGQSAIWYERGGIAAGVGSENQWWGPGLRDALLMTTNAAGIPHAFVRTRRPLRTTIGEFEGRWIVGRLRESDFYDLDPDNDIRSLSAAVVTYRPRWERDLVIGFARSVYGPAERDAQVLTRWFDVLRPGGRPNARSWSDSTLTGGRDQLASLFARWVFPDHGWELYGEVGRAERPASLRDLLVEPNHTMGYVLGGQHVLDLAATGGALRLQAEFTFLEQSPSYRHRPTQSWYTSRASPQGYTHRGQVIGAGVGPGSSHQWGAADYVAPSWSVGAFVGRWRFNADAWLLTPFRPGTGWCEFDTTLYPGLRGSYRDGLLGLVRAELVLGNRLNSFFQNNSGCPRGDHMRDVRNRTLRFWLQPRIPLR